MGTKVRMRLRTARIDNDLTQDRLVMRVAKHLPKGRTMSQARYSQIENGVGAPPDDDEQAAVAAAIGVKVTEIAWPDREARAS